MSDQFAAQAPPDRRWWLTQKSAALWAATKWQIYLYVYCRLIYRHHMRLLHRFGRHWFTHLRPMGGPEQDWCQWCGERRVRS
jgi:hypothetical protein